MRTWDGPERLVLRAIALITRPTPILTPAERRQFGIDDDATLPSQALLAPLMVEAHALTTEFQQRTDIITPSPTAIATVLVPLAPLITPTPTATATGP